MEEFLRKINMMNMHNQLVKEKNSKQELKIKYKSKMTDYAIKQKQIIEMKENDLKQKEKIIQNKNEIIESLQQENNMYKKELSKIPNIIRKIFIGNNKILKE
jgi:hypothetical protein